MLRLRKPSPAMAVACISLFIGLSGVGTAAVVLAKNSVLSKHIRNGQVKTPDLGANAVNSTKVGDGSLLAQDFAAGQLPAGPQGPQGPAGTVGSLDDLSGKPCTIKGQPGVVVLGKPDVKQGFGVNITCLREDEWEPNNTQALAYDATSVYVPFFPGSTGLSFNLQMSIYPAGDEDWVKLLAKPVNSGSVGSSGGTTPVRMNVYRDGVLVASNITSFDNSSSFASTSAADVHNWFFQVYQPAGQITADSLSVSFCC
jgi:hypothetical protein